MKINNANTTATNVINYAGMSPSHQSLTNPLVFPQLNTAGTPFLQTKVL